MGENFNNKPESRFFIPEEELTYEFFRSSGPGGQNVNKVNSGVRIRWRFEESKVLTEEEKEKVRKSLKNRINNEGDLIVENEETRSQIANRESAYENLVNLVNQALSEEKERLATKKTLSSQEKRLKEKREQQEKKKLRQIKPEDLD
ncbi:MAG: ribosome-associated protein [Patescibacteria group bacterium]|nr:ribosome-associated protein [Patescibacteria group bacterium]